MKKAALILAAFVAFLALAGCEPQSTVTAQVGYRDCLNQHLGVTGTVTPANATKKVILQRTSGGKWVDFAWYDNFSSGAIKAPISGTVAPSGRYELFVARDNGWTGEKLAGTFHFRVRTEGNGGISPSWYTQFQTC